MSHPRRPRNSESEDELLERLLRENAAEGLQRLLEAHGGRVASMLRSRFPGAFDAAGFDDVLAQAIHNAWLARHTYRSARGTARAWLGSIARNCALLELARRRRLELLFEDPDQRFVAPRAQASSRQLTLDLYACIDRLPKLQRAVLLADLAAHGRAKGAELAAANGSSLGSIYLARLRAIETLRADLAALGYSFARRSRKKEAPPQTRSRPPSRRQGDSGNEAGA